MSTDNGKKREILKETWKLVERVCGYYGYPFDDREEPARGKNLKHKSLETFRCELRVKYQLELSTAKLRKILITGNKWSTARSRRIEELMRECERKNMKEHEIDRYIADQLGITEKAVVMYSPYKSPAHDLEVLSKNAIRIRRCRKKKKEKEAKDKE